MKAALAQIAPKLADVDANLDLHAETVARARQGGAELVVFPELSLTGYVLMEAAPEVAIGLDSLPMKRLAEIFAGERTNLESQWGRGDNVSTEVLRVALQRYRSFFDRLLSV